MIGGVIYAQIMSIQPSKNRLAGRVTVNGVGSPKRVIVHKRGTLEYVASTHSKADGTFEIRNMPVFPEKSLVVMVFDDNDPGRNSLIFDKESQVE